VPKAPIVDLPPEEDLMIDPTRTAGTTALVAGVAFAVLDLGRLPVAYADDRVAALLDPVLRTLNAAYFFGFCGLVLALVALYPLHAAAAGTFGRIAFVAAIVGTITMAGDMWFDGFAAPWLAEVAPGAITVGATPILETGALLSYGLCGLGWLLYGSSMIAARTFPVPLGIAVLVCGIVAFRSSFPPYGVPLGLAVAATGLWALRAARRPVAV
jgi:hypothetical protein